MKTKVPELAYLGKNATHLPEHIRIIKKFVNRLLAGANSRHLIELHAEGHLERIGTSIHVARNVLALDGINHLASRLESLDTVTTHALKTRYGELHVQIQIGIGACRYTEKGIVKRLVCLGKLIALHLDSSEYGKKSTIQ